MQETKAKKGKKSDTPLFVSNLFFTLEFLYGSVFIYYGLSMLSGLYDISIYFSLSKAIHIFLLLVSVLFLKEGMGVILGSTKHIIKQED